MVLPNYWTRSRTWSASLTSFGVGPQLINQVEADGGNHTLLRAFMWVSIGIQCPVSDPVPDDFPYTSTATAWAWIHKTSDFSIPELGDRDERILMVTQLMPTVTPSTNPAYRFGVTYNGPAEGLQTQGQRRLEAIAEDGVTVSVALEGNDNHGVLNGLEHNPTVAGYSCTMGVLWKPHPAF